MEQQLVKDIIECGKVYHANADTIALLIATAQQESGGTYHATPGDNNSSFGPFQHHRGGALGSHDQAWAESKAAVCERAKVFTAAHAKTGEDAYRIQSPAASLHASYVGNINNYLPTAKQLMVNAMLPSNSWTDFIKGIGGGITDPLGTAATDVGNSTAAGPLNAAGDALGSVGDALRSITSFGATRTAMLVGGAALIFIGVVVVVKSEASNIVSSVV